MSTTLERERSGSHWGIEPVDDEHRKLTGLHLGLLWGDLGVGLLVLVSGSLLTAAPSAGGFGLGMAQALAAIALGSVIGCALLGYAGSVGTSTGQPSMVLFRPLLGIKGSWIPTSLNIAQLIGWTAVELWAMALVADRAADAWGVPGSFHMWLGVFTLIVLGLALWGPLGVVRTWMQRFGAWVIAIIGMAATVGVISHLSNTADVTWFGGGLAWLGVPMDVVIALPVSWVPLVADYNRFGRSPRASFIGTSTGYLIANIWFYALGAGLALAGPSSPVGPDQIASAALVVAGATISGILLLIGLLVGETDEGFADVYSAAVSFRNIFPDIDGRVFVVIVTAVGAALAAAFTMQAYEFFLLLLGSIFVPLIGVWVSDRVLVRHQGGADVGWRFVSFIGWGAGFIVYHWIAPTPLGWWTEITGKLFQPLWPRIEWLGASLPSLLVAAMVHLVACSIAKRIGTQPRS